MLNDVRRVRKTDGVRQLSQVRIASTRGKVREGAICPHPFRHGDQVDGLPRLVQVKARCPDFRQGNAVEVIRFQQRQHIVSDAATLEKERAYHFALSVGITR